METLWLFANKLSGGISLDNLPQSLKSLNLTSNFLSGSVCLEMLPESLNTLEIAQNEFVGPLSFDSLPDCLTYLSISCNAFCGELYLLKPPKSLGMLIADGNKFRGVARVKRGFEQVVRMSGNPISDVFDEDGKSFENSSVFTSPFGVLRRQKDPERYKKFDSDDE